MKSAVFLIIAGLLAGCAMYVHQPAELPGNLPGAWQSETSVSDLPLTAGLLDLMPDAREEGIAGRNGEI